MSLHNKINKAVYDQFQRANDEIQQILMQARGSSKLRIDDAQLQIIFTLVKASLETTFLKSNVGFDKQLDKFLAEEENSKGKENLQSGRLLGAKHPIN